METPPFTELGLSAPLLAAIEELGYERPSPIQALAIPPALEGRDLVGLSETGSGKTAAFVLPSLARLDLSQRKPQILILCPTRELAVQVCEEVHRLGAGLDGLFAAPIYGGAPIDRQFRALSRGLHVVVGTPGRLLDHARRGSFDPSHVRIAILDEADRMLDMGFREEMDEVLKMLPAERQTLFFSATMNPGVSRLIQNFGREPEVLEVQQKARTVSTVDQSYFEVRQRSKIEVLSRLLDMSPLRLALVFCNTKRSVDECTEALINRGYAADRLHGDMTQMMRERVLKRFREGSLELLVATDVAARGLDIDEIDAVFNYDLPTDPEDYVHRIGRTGRAGRSGKAVSFVFGRDIYRLQSIERYTRSVIRRERIPSQEQVEGRRADRIFDSLRDRLEKGDFQSYQDNVDRLLEQGHTATDIAGALITLLRESSGREGETIIEDRERDRPPREGRFQRDREKGGGRPPRDGDREGGEGRPPRREWQERPPRRDWQERPPRRDFDGKPPWAAGKGGKGGRRDEGPPADMARLFLSLGKAHGIMPKEIVGMLYREAGLPDDSLGYIKLFDRYSLVDIRKDVARQAIERTRNSRLKGQPFRMDFDKAPDKRDR